MLTDTNMALAGISKPALEKLGCKAVCYMADPDVAALRAPRARLAPLRAWTKLAASRVRSSWPSATLPQHFCASPSSWTREDRARAHRWGAGRVCERGRGERGVTRATRAGHRREGSQGRLDRGGRHYERAALPDHAHGWREVTPPHPCRRSHLRRHHRGPPSVRMGERGGHPRPCLRGNRVRRRAFG